MLFGITSFPRNNRPSRFLVILQRIWASSRSIFNCHFTITAETGYPPMLRSPGHDNVNNIITRPENGPEFLAASAASATAVAASATASTVAQQQPPRKRRRYRRAPETRLSEATRASLRVEIDKSHSNARAKSTMDTYMCYKRAIDPWYTFNQPELTIDGKINCAKILEECRTLECKKFSRNS